MRPLAPLVPAFPRRILAALGVVVGAICLALLWTGGTDGRQPLAISEAERTDAEPTEAGRAMEWRRLAWRDDLGKTAGPKEWLRADAELRTALARSGRKILREPSAPFGKSAGLRPGAWAFRGPDNVGGRTRAILIDPRNSSRILAGSVSGGLWESLDAGGTWRAIGDDLPNLAIGSLAFDPTNPNTIYMGTGEGQFNGDAIQGAGLFKSLDSGATWTLLPPTAGWAAVTRIAVSRQNPQRLLAAVRYGGVFRSTDGGASWQNVLAEQGSLDVEIDPSNDQNAVADLLGFDFSGAGWFHEAHYSRDGGQTWNRSATPGRVVGFGARIELAYAPSNPAIVYASVGAESGSAASGIWRSSDGGATFVQRTTFAPGNWYFNTLWVDPKDPQIVVVGGYELHRSLDGGLQFAKISDGYLLTTQPHPDQHWIVEDPGYDGTANRRVYVGNDGGVFRTNDIRTASTTGGWQSLNQGYNTTQYYSGKIGGSGLVFGGLQDNGTLSIAQDTTSAFLTYGGDGTSAEIDSRTVSDVAYGSYVGLQDFFRATNNGQSIAGICGNLSECGSANFIPPFILDPNNRDRLLAGAKSLWATDNARTGNPPHWRTLRAPDVSNISAIAVAPGNSSQIWIAFSDNRVYRTENGTAAQPHWQTIDDNGATDPLPSRYPTRIVVDRTNPRHAWITFGGFTSDNVWQTFDAGASWTSSSGSGSQRLPSAPVRAFVQHPEHSTWLYAGTEVGVFASTDGGASWEPENQGPVNVSVDELSFQHGTTVLVAATHGRGIWTIQTQLGACVEDARTICLQDGRFEVQTRAWDHQVPPRLYLASFGPRIGDVSFLSSFFSVDNKEQLGKVIDACSFNGKFWFFMGSTTDVEFETSVRDTVSGLTRVYHNADLQQAPALTDTAAFDCGASPGSLEGQVQELELNDPGQRIEISSGSASMAPCLGNAETACLQQGRFEVRTEAWGHDTPRTRFQAKMGPAIGDVSFLASFFSADNKEQLGKILDGCALNGHYWFFMASTTDVEFTTTVRDRLSGRLRTYHNRDFQQAPAVTDTGAFPCSGIP